MSLIRSYKLKQLLLVLKEESVTYYILYRNVAV